MSTRTHQDRALVHYMRHRRAGHRRYGAAATDSAHAPTTATRVTPAAATSAVTTRRGPRVVGEGSPSFA